MFSKSISLNAQNCVDNEWGKKTLFSLAPPFSTLSVSVYLLGLYVPCLSVLATPHCTACSGVFITGILGALGGGNQTGAEGLVEIPQPMFGTLCLTANILTYF